MHKPIMFVGEYWNEQEAHTGQAFAGPSGNVLRGIMRQIGVEPAACHFTNVFNQRPPGGRLEGFCGPKEDAIPGYRQLTQKAWVHKKYQFELDRLWEELERHTPHVIVALGNTALWALCKKTGIRKYRGSPLPTHDNKFKVIPTWNPSSIMRQWELRVIAMADINKANRESAFPEIRRPSRYIFMEPNLQDIDDFYNEFLLPSPFVSCDIETKNKTITEVGYSNAEGDRALVIPFYYRASADGNYWPTLEDEIEAWKKIAWINSEKPLIGQNFSYDMQYFWRTVGIPCPKFLGDTMLLHHSLQPEMEKGLGFLGSIYTNEPSWKFMRTDHSTMKRGDD